jgi:uncharacterized protein (DUF1810 family)
LDAFDLDRFVLAQEGNYPDALSELLARKKRSHWMWFVFPQIEGLGHSPMAEKYAIRSLKEASAYLAHPVLGPRLRECTEALLHHQGRSASEIFGHPDDLKFRSSMPLFDVVSPGDVFGEALEVFFNGTPDELTLANL